MLRECWPFVFGPFTHCYFQHTRLLKTRKDIFASRACPAFLVFDSAAFLADMTIDLPCHCKPEETHSVVWYYQKQVGSMNTKVLTDFEGTTVVESSKVGRGSDLRSRFSIRLFSLLIFRVQKADSGHYICGTASGEFFYGYDVDIQEVHKVLFPWNVKQRTQEAEPISIKTKSIRCSPGTGRGLNVTAVTSGGSRCV